VHEHPAAEMRIEDTGLGIPRTERIVMVQVSTRPESLGETEFLRAALSGTSSALRGEGVGRRCFDNPEC